MKNSGYHDPLIAMKTLTTPLLATLLVLSARLVAAEPESSFGLAPSPAPQLAPASNLPLIPEPVQPVEKPKGKAAPAGEADKTRGDKTAMAEDKLKRNIQLRQAKTKAEREPALQALKAQALEASTDYEQRKLFIDYYTRLCDRIAKYDPALKKEDIATLKQNYTGRYLQTRIAPTIDPDSFRTQRN
jgi:hypothetical protein